MLAAVKDERYYAETLRGRLEIRWWGLRYRGQQIPESFWRRLAWLLPRPLILWALVRVAVGTLGNDEHPDILNYGLMYDRWQKGVRR